MDELTPDIAFSRFQPEPAAGRQQLARAARAGVAKRVARGAYVPMGEWEQLSPREKYIARITAVSATRKSTPTISHQSAAAIHGLPMVAPWPFATHTTVPPNVGMHSRANVTRHGSWVPPEDIVRIGDLFVTSVARTVIDVAAYCSFLEGVVVADAALAIDRFGDRAPMVTPDALTAAFERASPMRASTRVSEVIAFADTRAESPIESVSRVNMRVIGAPRPQLQVAHFDSAGFIGETDFAWPELGIVGEADGDRKYLDQAFRSGRTVEQVLLDEKHREDRIRALPRRFGRWPWATAIDPVRLRTKLIQMGVPVGVHWELAGL